ncbi:EI24 domain-containing protein [Lysobacter korlensis]|uniref:EI24 domain-containing protein n=1 Tax=Lysobacter korlensis TaxID=553636 RepID=A0ABV6RXZ1_9GAMM
MQANVRLQEAVTAAARSGTVRQFVAGVRLLGRGLGMWATTSRLMLLGAIPAFIVAILYAVLLILFFTQLDFLATWITPFAENWDTTWRTAVRLVAGAALLALAVLLVIFTFTAITLAVGDPFYERIWREVEQRLGNPPPESDEPFWRSIPRGIGNGLRLLLLTAVVGLPLFLLAFVPVVGQIVAPVLGVLFGGWLLAVELTGFAFDSRRISLRDRRRALAVRRPTALGFGVATYLLFLIPFGAVLVMPAAVAGATLLARSALDPQPPTPS